METIVNKTESQSSFEFGRSGSRMKIYFDVPEQLESKIKKLRELGLVDSEGNPILLSE